LDCGRVSLGLVQIWMLTSAPFSVSGTLVKPNLGSPPRRLTEAELDDVIDVVPRVMAACRQVSTAVRSEICHKLRLQLKELVICVEGIPQLKEDIKRMFDNSRVQPGTTVGIATSEASGLPIMQMTLNSFHQTGSAANVSRGIESVRELFNMTKKRKHESTTIHFRRKNMTYEEVLDLRRQLVGVSLSSILLRKAYTENVVPMHQREWWYDAYSAVMGKTVLAPNYYLRLHFDPDRLFAYQITLDEITRILEAERVVKCVASPTYLGIIDVYPDQGIIGKMVTDKLGDHYGGITAAKAPLFYLQNFLVPNLDKITIRGIPSLQQIFPVSVPTWTLVKDEQPYFTIDELELYLSNLKNNQKSDSEIQLEQQRVSRMWRVWIDVIKFRTTGIPISKFVKLLIEAKIQILLPAIDPLQLEALDAGPLQPVFVIQLPESLRPGELIRQKLADDQAAMIANEDELKRQGTPYPIRQTSPLFRAGNYVYAEANGTSLRQVYSHPLVDSRTTISNNYHEILATLGIEATRNFLLRDYHEIFIYNGAYVNYRYIALIVDFQTSLGTLLSVTSRGIARQNISVLALSTFDQPMDTFVNAAAFGKKEEVRNVSTAIFLGKRALIGTGSFDLELESKSLDEADERDQAVLQRLANVEDMRSAIEGIGDLHFDTDTFQFDPESSELDAMFNREGPRASPQGSPGVSINNPRYRDSPNPPHHDLGPAARGPREPSTAWMSAPESLRNNSSQSLGSGIVKRLDFGAVLPPDNRLNPLQSSSIDSTLSIGNGISLVPKGPIPMITPSILGLPSSIRDLIGDITVRSPPRSSLFASTPPRNPRSPPRSSVFPSTPPRNPSMASVATSGPRPQVFGEQPLGPEGPVRLRQPLADSSLPSLDFDRLTGTTPLRGESRGVGAPRRDIEPRPPTVPGGRPVRGQTVIDLDDFLQESFRPEEL